MWKYRINCYTPKGDAVKVAVRTHHHTRAIKWAIKAGYTCIASVETAQHGVIWDAIEGDRKEALQALGMSKVVRTMTGKTPDECAAYVNAKGLKPQQSITEVFHQLAKG